MITIGKGGKRMCFRPTTAMKATTCPKCGAINPSMAKFCLKCKTPLEEDKKEDNKKEE